MMKLVAICSTLLVIATFTSAADEEAKVIEWQINGRNYVIRKSSATREEAKAFCREQGALLPGHRGEFEFRWQINRARGKFGLSRFWINDKDDACYSTAEQKTRHNCGESQPEVVCIKPPSAIACRDEDDGRKCYFHSSFRTTCRRAFKYCDTFGGTVPYLTSEADQQWVLDNFDTMSYWSSVDNHEPCTANNYFASYRRLSLPSLSSTDVICKLDAELVGQ